MKNLKKSEMSKISGGGYTNKQCAIVGGGTFLALVTGLWGSALSLTTLAAVQGCFENF